MTRIQYWIAVALGAACLAAMAANLTLGWSNQSSRADIGQRQQYVQQSVQLEGLYREMVRALAELSARHGDEALRALLQRHGINVNPSAPAPAAAAPPKARP